MARVRYVHVPRGTVPPQFLGQPDRRPVIGPAIRPAQQKQSAFLEYFYAWIGIMGIGGLLVGVLLFNEFRSPGATAELVQWLTSGQFVKDTPGMVQDTMRGERTVQVEPAVGNPPTPVPSTGYNFTAPSGPVPTSAPNIVAQPGPAPVVVDLVPTAEPLPQVTIEALPVLQPTADYSGVDPWHHKEHTWVAPTPYPTVVMESGIVVQPLRPQPTAIFDALDLAARQAEVAALCAQNPNQIFCGTP